MPFPHDETNDFSCKIGQNALTAILRGNFTSTRTEGERGYGHTADRMVALAARMPGFLGVESVRGADGLGIIVSCRELEGDVWNWKARSEHRVAQAKSKAVWYADYTIRVAKVERSYSKNAGRYSRCPDRDPFRPVT